MVITSLQNQQIKNIIALKDKKGRVEQNAYLVEGVKMVREAIALSQKVKLIIGLKEIVDTIEYSGEIIYTDNKVLNKISNCETCQGVFAVIEKPANDFCLPKENCVLLDRVRDPGNLGTIIRTSVAVGIKRVYLRDCVDAYSPKVVRSSMSGIYSVELSKIDDEQVADLAQNATMISADMQGKNLFDYTSPSKFCLCMGNEANGLSELVKGLTKEFISIPMQNGIESLNVGVAYAVAIYNLINNKT
jgi:TrmH family RNA methyltransferase